MLSLLGRLKGSMLHPQWLSDRFHLTSREALRSLRNALVLDIGSGDASYGSLLHASCRHVTLDYPVTSAHYRKVPQIYGSVCALPVADRSIDCALLLEVLEHVDDDHTALNEIARVLRPGGSLYISVPFLYPIHDAPHDYRRYTLHGLSRLLGERGFAIHDTRQHGNALLVPAQLFNLALLEIARGLWQRNALAGLIAALAATPLYLAVNVIAWPFTFSSRPRRQCFGYFVHATLDAAAP